MKKNLNKYKTKQRNFNNKKTKNIDWINNILLQTSETNIVKEKNKIKDYIIISLYFSFLITSYIIISLFRCNSYITIHQESKVFNKLSYLENVAETFDESKVIIIENNENEIQNKEEEKEELKIEKDLETTSNNEITIISYPYIEATGYGNENISKIASSQVGNVGGEIYWSWYGFTSRVAWCGCFVSWVANQAGISENIIPKFSRVVDGANWFINRQLFRDRNYSPRVGDLIFFDYDHNGKADHVGIVKTVSNGKVYTIEGNVKNNQCKELSHTIGNELILGYGTPNY